MELVNIEVIGEFKHLQIKELTDSGGNHRRSLSCNVTLADDEHQEVKDKAEEVWTDEVKSAYATFLAKQKAELPR